MYYFIIYLLLCVCGVFIKLFSVSFDLIYLQNYIFVWMKKSLWYATTTAIKGIIKKSWIFITKPLYNQPKSSKVKVFNGFAFEFSTSLFWLRQTIVPTRCFRRFLKIPQIKLKIMQKYLYLQIYFLDVNFLVSLRKCLGGFLKSF